MAIEPVLRLPKPRRGFVYREQPVLGVRVVTVHQGPREHGDLETDDPGEQVAGDVWRQVMRTFGMLKEFCEGRQWRQPRQLPQSLFRTIAIAVPPRGMLRQRRVSAGSACDAAVPCTSHRSASAPSPNSLPTGTSRPPYPVRLSFNHLLGPETAAQTVRRGPATRTTVTELG